MDKDLSERIVEALPFKIILKANISTGKPDILKKEYRTYDTCQRTANKNTVRKENPTYRLKSSKVQNFSQFLDLDDQTTEGSDYSQNCIFQHKDLCIANKFEEIFSFDSKTSKERTLGSNIRTGFTEDFMSFGAFDCENNVICKAERTNYPSEKDFIYPIFKLENNQQVD